MSDERRIELNLMAGESSVLLTISILLSATIALAYFVLAPRMLTSQIVFDSTPDSPAAFGYQMAWLAIRSVDTAHVLETLGLAEPQPTNWSNGLGTVYDAELGNGRIFVSPPVEGWTFVVGLSLPQPLGPHFADKCTPLLLDLGSVYPAVHYYLCDAAMENYAWARMENGKLKRAFAFGDDGISWNKGKVTPEENELGLEILAAPRNRRQRTLEHMNEIDYPSQAHVVYLAGRWSLDPTMLDGQAGQRGTGYIGWAQSSWAATRLRRAG